LIYTSVGCPYVCTSDSTVVTVVVSVLACRVRHILHRRRCQTCVWPSASVGITPPPITSSPRLLPLPATSEGGMEGGTSLMYSSYLAGFACGISGRERGLLREESW